ncbi:MAG: TIGR02444 family protein [Myxococcales bacterium]|nr:TIGR02444 family protein [Myxococcales bacterium]
MTDPSAPIQAPCESLWDFAARTYEHEGVAQRCLRLQDEHGLDVDVLLACLWRARDDRSVDDVDLDAMVEAAAAARRWVVAIRELRRAVGLERQADPRWQEAYEHLRAAELAAERVELRQLEAAAGPVGAAGGGDPAARALQAMRRYALRQEAGSCDALLAELVEHALGRPTTPG